MPHCLNCGNYVAFGSSKVPPVAPTANGPISGLIADFTEDNSIATMESLGASLDEAQEAWENPRRYFDVCSNCGSSKVQW